jgi:hypothetical protein
LCTDKNIFIVERRVLGREFAFVAKLSPNVFGEVALYHIEKGLGA